MTCLPQYLKYILKFDIKSVSVFPRTFIESCSSTGFFVMIVLLLAAVFWALLVWSKIQLWVEEHLDVSFEYHTVSAEMCNVYEFIFVSVLVNIGFGYIDNYWRLFHLCESEAQLQVMNGIVYIIKIGILAFKIQILWRLFTDNLYLVHNCYAGCVCLQMLQNGIVSGAPYLFMWLFITASGIVCDKLRTKRIISTTRVRKLCISIG